MFKDSTFFNPLMTDHIKKNAIVSNRGSDVCGLNCKPFLHKSTLMVTAYTIIVELKIECLLETVHFLQ